MDRRLIGLARGGALGLCRLFFCLHGPFGLGALVCLGALRGLRAGRLAAGILGVFVSTRVMTSLLFNVTPTDPVTIAAATLAMMMVVLMACYIPARRAIRIDPTHSLRYE